MISQLTSSSMVRTAYNPAKGERLKDFIRYTEVRELVYKIADLQRRPQDAFSSLAVLSLYPSEGKTLLCAALAAAYAETCRTRVLAVDTTTMRNPKSLSLKECIDPADPMIDFISLTDHRNGESEVSDVIHAPAGVAFESEVMDRGFPGLGTPPINEQYLVTKVTRNGAKQYGLVILDTAPLTARNKNNFDPALVSRLSDASVLVIGPRALSAADMPERLQALKDSGIRLIGAVSNEEFSQ